MPYIASLLPAAPATPAATPAPTASTSAVAPGTLLPPDLDSPTFLAQFKTALKTIARVVVQPQPTPRAVADPGSGPLLSPVSDEPELPAAVDADKPMPEILAALGFAVVPLAFPMPTPPKVLTTADGGAAPAPLAPERRIQPPALLSAAATPVNVPQARLSPVMQQASAGPVQLAPEPAIAPALPKAPPVLTLDDAFVPRTHPVTPRVATQRVQDPKAPVASTSDAPLPKAPVASTSDAPLPKAPVPNAPVASASPAAPQPDVLPQGLPQTAPIMQPPLEHLKPSDRPHSSAPTATAPSPVAIAPELSATVMLQSTPGTPAPTSAAPAATAAPQIGFPRQPSPGGAQSGNARSDHNARRTPDRVASVSSAGDAVAAAPVSDAVMVAAAAASAPIDANTLPVAVGPSQVVSQIAQHAEVIRLPGNRGLRIQLHPEDLGGVQVTLRYTPAGGVELHINAEHAATGALVQAGWTELRDALAGHGITADRLMMTVTAPLGAGQADLSGGAGNRSAPDSSTPSQNGQTNLSSPDSQGQGQSRQDNTPQRASQTWSRTVEPVAPTDDNARVASTTAAPARIDYRV